MKYCPDCKADLEVGGTDAIGLVTGWHCTGECGIYWTIQGRYHSPFCSAGMFANGECSCVPARAIRKA